MTTNYSEFELNRINTSPKEDMLKGINKVGNVVKTTLGPYGRNVAIMRQSLASMPLVTDDGVRVAEFCIESLENYELLGAKLVYEASKRTEEEVGDGTTTSYLLSQSIINQYMTDYKNSDVTKVLLRKALEKVGKELIERMDKYRIVADDPEILHHIANVSAGRSDIGDLVGEVRKTIGLDGLISIKFSRNNKDLVDYSKGYEISGGFDQTQFYDDSNKANFDNPLVVVADKMLMVKEDIDKFIDGYGLLCNALNKPIFETPMIILCRKCDGDAKRVLIHNWYFRGDGKMLPIIPIEVSIGYDPKGTMEDLASVVNGKLIEETAQLTKELVVSSTGSVDQLSSNKKSTMLISSNDKSINKRIEVLENAKKTLIDKSDSGEINNLEVRIAKLKGQAATIHVGGNTPTECNERKLKFDDAILATRSAIKEGVLSGGGIAQILAIIELSDYYNNYVGDDLNYVAMAVTILHSALESTFIQLVENTGMLVDSVRKDKINDIFNTSVIQNINKYSTIDLSTIEVTNDNTLDDMKVFDPYMVLITSINNAISVASQFITIDTAVVLPANNA